MTVVLARVGQSLVVLLVMSFVVYGLIGLMPGDPVDLLAAGNPRITPEDIARLRELYDVDRPLLVRYLEWLGRVLGGDLGHSRLHARPVIETLLPPLGRTVVLLSASLVVALVIAVPLGMVAALRPRSVVDYAVNGLAFAGISMPVFWLGLMLIVVFAVTLQWLPAGGVAGIAGGVGGSGVGDLGDRLRHLVLPVATLAAAHAGHYARYTRSAMIEALRQDYIRTAFAKGAGRTRVLFRHALRNALIPLATIVALDVGSLFSGALITETVFAYPGMGRLIFEAVMGNDFNLALAGLMLATAVTLAGNALADLAYVWLDPRLRRRA